MKRPSGWTEGQWKAVQRSWALADMYLQPLFPPPEKAHDLERQHHEALDNIEAMMAAGLSYNVARRTYIGLPPYPSTEAVARFGSSDLRMPCR